MTVFVHPMGLCESGTVGEGTRVWAFAHVLAGAVIGRDANICDHVFIENDVVVGDRVTLKSGVQLWDGVRLADDVFVGPNVSFSNDRFPRSKAHPESYVPTVVEQGASIGAGAVILPGITIGRGAMVGAGSVVVHDVPPHAVVVGNPARIQRYLSETSDTASSPTSPGPVADHTVAKDLRGSLMAIDIDADLPFTPRRFFSVHAVPSRAIRGTHAHRECHQYLIALAGTVRCIMDDGHTRKSILLDSPGIGLHIPPMTWSTQYDYSSDAVLGVFASHPYDPDDYIRTYGEFLTELSRDSRSPV